MSTHGRAYDEDAAPPAKVTKNTRLTTNLGAALAVCAAIWLASRTWNNTQRDSSALSEKVEDHTRQLTTLQATVGDLHDGFRELKANQNAQTEILRYLARDRKGPVPEAAK